MEEGPSNSTAFISAGATLRTSTTTSSNTTPPSSSQLSQSSPPISTATATAATRPAANAKTKISPFSRKLYLFRAASVVLATEKMSLRPSAAASITIAPTIARRPELSLSPLPRSHFPTPPAAPAKYTTTVVWFRGDLRLHDHPALAHALEEAAVVVPVYCFDPRQFGKTPFGFEKTGRYRAKFLLEAIADLRTELQRRGADLLIRLGRPEDVLPELCRSVGANSVFYHQEVSYEEQLVERQLTARLEHAQVEHKSFWTNTLYHVEDLPYDNIQDMPDVYTEFRETVQRECVIRVPLPVPDSMPVLPFLGSVDVGKVPSLADLGLSEPDPAVNGIHALVGGEREAVSRLDAYISESRSVPDGRSVAVHLGADFSCKISPWLALGCLSARRIHSELSARAAKAGQTSTFFELIWRDFFRFITWKYARARLESADRSMVTSDVRYQESARSGQSSSSYGDMEQVASKREVVMDRNVC